MSRLPAPLPSFASLRLDSHGRSSAAARSLHDVSDVDAGAENISLRDVNHGSVERTTTIKKVESKPAETLEKNIMLMTDGYKFSHHKQYPVSWMPKGQRPTTKDKINDFCPKIIYDGTEIDKFMAAPLRASLKNATTSAMIIVTNTSTVTVEVKTEELPRDYKEVDTPPNYTWNDTDVQQISFHRKDDGSEIVSITMGFELMTELGLSQDFVWFKNIDMTKIKKGSKLNQYTGGYNVSYFTARAYDEAFKRCEGDGDKNHVVFFGLQYFIKTYLEGNVITKAKLDEAEAFVARFMCDVRGEGFKGHDYSVFPRGDWHAMLTGNYDHIDTTENIEIQQLMKARAGTLPIKIEALPEGTCVQPGIPCFKVTNTHPRFFWLPNYLETLLVQVWYPITVATQAREFRKIYMAHSVLSCRRTAPVPPNQPKVFTAPLLTGNTGKGKEFTTGDVALDQTMVINQVFDVLDFGYRGVSSHETASLGAAAYYITNYQGSDTVAGSRMLLRCYGDGLSDQRGFKNYFEIMHGATSLPAAEHSTVTSWVSDEDNPDPHNENEQASFVNMMEQYKDSYAVALVSDGFNIWNALANQWTSEKMTELLKQRNESGKLTLLRPDSGKAIETLPQLLTMAREVLEHGHWDDGNALGTIDPNWVVSNFGDTATEAELAEYKQKYNTIVDTVRMHVNAHEERNATMGKIGSNENANPFRSFKGQQFRILQGDGVALNTVEDMLASILANGFCANTVHFGTGGGMLQKVNRDSLSCAFKCCAMYVDPLEGGERVLYKIKKKPIAGGKDSFAGDPKVERNSNGVFSKASFRTKDFAPDKPVASSSEGNQLVAVFYNGEIKIQSNDWQDMMDRARVTDLSTPLKRATDNLFKKMNLFQRFSSKEAMDFRYEEAELGSKWFETVVDGTKHPLFKRTLASDDKHKQVLNLIRDGDIENADKALAEESKRYVLTL